MNSRKYRFHEPNPQQNLAVTHGAGPLLVLAGPGTGKTQVICARIERLVKTAHVSPERIICFTFSDAGADTLRKRLEAMEQPELRSVPVHTFHSFCNEVIQENEALFYLRSAQPAEELDRVNVLSRLLDELPGGHPLKRLGGNAYYDIPDLLALFSNLKREALEPAPLLASIANYRSQLLDEERFYYQRNGAGFQKGDVKQAQLRQQETSLTQLAAAVELYEQYNQLLARQHRYDFDDMIRLVVNAFEQNPALLIRYQESYDYWLVDEYQDSSGAQNRLLELLTAHDALPNLMVVGDDDQSIYRFQGASLDNMLGIHQRFGDALTTVVLTQNYRSTQSILDAAERVIGHNEQRLIHRLPGLQKRLVTRDSSTQETSPEAFSFDNMEAERAWLAAEIGDRLKAGVPPAAIAVLCRDNQQLLALVTALRSADLPVQTRHQYNLLHEPVVGQVLQLLRFVDAELDVAFAGDNEFFRLLHLPFLGVPPVEIANAALQASAKRPAQPIRAFVLQKKEAATDLFSAEAEPPLLRAACLLEGLLNLGAQGSLADLLQGIFDHTGLVNYLISRPGRSFTLQCLRSFQAFVESQMLRQPGLDLHGLLRIIARMSSQGISLPLQWTDGPQEAVPVMTVHGSKGLEFEEVFLAGCTADKWEKRRAVKRPFSLPAAVVPHLQQTGSLRDVEEERRLFYVALTRAERRFTATCVRLDSRGRTLTPSGFLAEMTGDDDVPEKTVAAAVLQQHQVQRLLAQRPVMAAPELGYVQRAVKQFRMSVSALNNYLDCPLRFYVNNILRVPGGRNEYSSFGTAIHAALEQLFRQLRHRNDVFAPVEELIGWFEESMADLRSFFTPEQYANRLAYGRQVLTGYYQQHIRTWNRIVSIEKNISTLYEGRIPLTGKIDKLEFDGRLATIVDYKTGRYDRAREELQPPNPQNPLGGNYWRQAVFYKLLVEADAARRWQVRQVQFDYVEPVKPGDYRRWLLTVSPEDEAVVRQQLEAVWAKIQAHDFYMGCGKPGCSYCRLGAGSGG